MYFKVLPNLLKNKFSHKTFMVKPCLAFVLNLKFCRKIFLAAALQLVKSAKIFDCKNFRLYGRFKGS